MIADTPLSIAAISKGSLCSASKVNQVVKSGKYFYICKQVGAKNKWALSTNKAYLAFKIKTDEELAKLNAEFESQKNAQNEIDAENTQAEKDANNAQAKRDAEIAQEKNDSLSKGTSYNCLIGKYCSIGNIGADCRWVILE